MLSEELGLQKLLKGREGRACSGSARQFVPPTTTLNISCVIVTLIVTLQLHPGERERDTVLVAQVSALGMGSLPRPHPHSLHAESHLGDVTMLQATPTLTPCGTALG